MTMILHKKELLKRIGLVMFSTILVLSGLEMAFRIVDPIKFESLINDTTKNWTAPNECGIFDHLELWGTSLSPILIYLNRVSKLIRLEC